MSGDALFSPAVSFRTTCRVRFLARVGHRTGTAFASRVRELRIRRLRPLDDCVRGRPKAFYVGERETSCVATPRARTPFAARPSPARSRPRPVFGRRAESARFITAPRAAPSGSATFSVASRARELRVRRLSPATVSGDCVRRLRSTTRPSRPRPVLGRRVEFARFSGPRGASGRRRGRDVRARGRVARARAARPPGDYVRFTTASEVGPSHYVGERETRYTAS